MVFIFFAGCADGKPRTTPTGRGFLGKENFYTLHPGLQDGAFWVRGKRTSDLNPSGDFKTMREKMVETQIKARGVKDPRGLSVMIKVERHLFVPKELQPSAYTDQPLPIGEGQTISQPYIVALMTELLELKGEERVLEIGTGSGYQAAILAELVKEVYTIEIIETLATSAKKLFSRMGY